MGVVKRTHHRAVLFQRYDKIMRNAMRNISSFGLFMDWRRYPEYKGDYTINRSRNAQRQWLDEWKRQVLSEHD